MRWTDIRKCVQRPLERSDAVSSEKVSLGCACPRHSVCLYLGCGRAHTHTHTHVFAHGRCMIPGPACFLLEEFPQQGHPLEKRKRNKLVSGT